MNRSFVFLVMFAWGVSGCNPPLPSACETNGHCVAGNVCRKGACVEPLTNSVSGAVDGKSITAQSATFWKATADEVLYDNNGLGSNPVSVRTREMIYLLVSSAPGVRRQVESFRSAKDSFLLVFYFFRHDEQFNGLSVVPGTYEVQARRDAEDFRIAPNFRQGVFVELRQNDGQCKPAMPFTVGNGVAGHVTIESMEVGEGGSMTGTFDLVVGEQRDLVQGTFSSEHCERPVDTLQPVCE